MRMIGCLLVLAACGSKGDANRDRERKAVELQYTALGEYAACLAGTREVPKDLFVVLAFKAQVPLPSSCPPPTLDGVAPPDLVDTKHVERIERVCEYLRRAYVQLDGVAKRTGAKATAAPTCEPATGVDWMPSNGERYGRSYVRDGVAYQDGGSGGKSWWAYSTDGSSWHTHELESSPLSFRMRGDTVAAVVGAGSEQQLYVGTDKALLPRPKRKMLASMVKIGEQPGSIVLVGGDDTWQTAAWSADGGETFGPDQKIVKPEFVIARSVMLGAGDSVIAATADEKQPVLVIHRAERGQPAKEVARFPYADDDYVAAINSCQSGQTIWVMASARQVVVSLDGGAAWTALPPVTLAEDGAVMHDATLTCSAGALGIRTGKEVALCDAKACAAPIPTPPAVTNYLRVTPKPELWSLGEVGSDRLVTVHRVEATLVPDRAYVLLASAMPLIYADGGFVLLDDN